MHEVKFCSRKLIAANVSVELTCHRLQQTYEIIKKFVHAQRASIELWMHAGSWKSTREAFEWHEAKPSALLASGVFSQLPTCIHNSTDAQLKHEPFLLEHCQYLHVQEKLHVSCQNTEFS